MKEATGPVDTLDTKIQTLLTQTGELLDLTRATASVQAEMADTTARLESSTVRLESDSRQLRLTTKLILGLTRKTAAITGALRSGRFREAFVALLLDEWVVLVLYLVLHPFAPASMEMVSILWQPVLFLSRLISLPADLRSGRLLPTSFSAAMSIYFTCPWKAIAYLHWVTHRALEMRGTPLYSEYFPGWNGFRLQQGQATANPFLSCGATAAAAAAPIPFEGFLSCCFRSSAIYSLLLLAQLFQAAAMPGILLQIGHCLELDQYTAAKLWGLLLSSLRLLFWSSLVSLEQAICSWELQLGEWVGPLRPFQRLCL